MPPFCIELPALTAVDWLNIVQKMSIYRFSVNFAGRSWLTDKAGMLKGEYDSVSEEVGSIYYRGFSEDEIAGFENCLQRILHNLEEAEDNL